MKVFIFVVAIYLFICSAVAVFPSASSSQPVSSTIQVSGTYDGGMKRFYGSGSLGSGGQSESQPPIFKLASGATLKNVIIGSPAADGVHCDGSCTIQNVWWEDVGEDAATFRGASATSLVDGGGARKAADKVFQHNGGGTLTIRNFEVSDFGKLYRSCGNCGTQYKRTVKLENVVITAPGKSVVGINTNYGDSATFSNVYVVGDSSKKIKICEKYEGNSNGKEPKSLGSGPDSSYCKYSTSDIVYTSSPPSIGSSTTKSSTSSTTKSSTSSTTKSSTSSTTKSSTSTTTGSASSTTGSSTTRKFYTIKNVNSNRCIDVKDASTADGGNIVQYSCSSSRETQIWELKPAGDPDYYYLVNYKTGKYADVENCGTGDDVNVRQWAGLNNNCQQFLFDNAANGIWRFINRNSGKVLTVKDCSTSNNGDVRQRTNANTDCQKWIMTRVLN